MDRPKKCWEVNPGCGEGIEKCKSCPAHKAKNSCWEFDWKPIADRCDQEQIEYWKQFLERRCMLLDCPVYDQHKKELDEIMLMFEKCKIM